MNLNYNRFREAFFQQGLFSTDHIRLRYPAFNTDNLLYWQKQGYICRLRNKWYCFRELLSVPDHAFLIANNIYRPSYISHQQALAFYGLIPEHIVDSTSVTTRKTSAFTISGRTFKYYAVSPGYFFGYTLMETNVLGLKRSIMIADREKAILDLLYIYDFYKTAEDLAGIRFNENALDGLDWTKMDSYLEKFHIKTLEKKVKLIRKIYSS